MPPSTPITGSPLPEKLTGTAIAILAPGYRGAVTQLDPASAGRSAADRLPLAAAAAGADAFVVAQLDVAVEAAPARVDDSAGRAGQPVPPRLILPKRNDVEYAVLQTGEDGYSHWILPTPGTADVVFELAPTAKPVKDGDGRAAVTSAMRGLVRVVGWAVDPALRAGALAIATAWEKTKRPYGLRQVTPDGRYVQPDWPALSSGPLLLLVHGTFSTPEAAFHGWVGSEAFKTTAQKYGGRCLAVAHPSLSASPDDNVAWMSGQFPGPIKGPVDVVCHSRGGLVARRLAATDALKVRRVCQVGTPNAGTPLAHVKHLVTFLDGHTALLTQLPDSVSTIVLEGVLCLVKLAAAGAGHGLPGLAAMEPEGAYLQTLSTRQLNAEHWFTIGANYKARPSYFARRAADTIVDRFFGADNDLVVPSEGCHVPGPGVSDSLRIEGDVHHCSYFMDPRVHGRLTAWLDA